MLPFSQRVAFLLFALACIVLAARGFWRMYRRITRGRADTDRRGGHLARRAWYALWTTLTQERVFRRRRVLSVLHLFIFYAFVLYLLVNAIDAVEGFVPLGGFSGSVAGVAYRALTDFFSFAAIVAVLAFVLRRIMLPSRRDFRFNARTLLSDAVRTGSIGRDSAVVSAFIVLHIGSRVIGNAAGLAMHGRDAAEPFSSLLAPALAGPHVMAWRIAGYWGALGSVLLFLVYFPYSKHIHLLMAPVKYFFRREAGSGELPPLRLDLEAAKPETGASTLAELTWPRLLDGYACIQCNRCQDVCPASVTGKALSPAALEINKRSALNAVGREVSVFSLAGEAAFEAGRSDGPRLLEAVISPEAVWACTTCGACMEVCPTQDEQMLDIVDIRRNLVLQEGNFPAQLQTAFRGMERNKNPWGLAANKRMAWAEGLDVPTVEDLPAPEVLYWVGCAASYDPGAQKTARAVVQLLREAGVRFAVLGERETCTGDSARRAGNELLYQELAEGAIKLLNAAAPKQILASCPHCVNVLGTEYRQMGGHYTVAHHTEFFAGLIAEGKMKPRASSATVAFHDPCYLGRHRGTYEEPRSLLRVLTDDVVELKRNRNNAFCCGAGGAQFWKEEETGDERISENRFREAQTALASRNSDGERILAVGCPFCKSMLQSTPSAGQDASIVVKDVAELLWEGVRPERGIAESSGQKVAPEEPLAATRKRDAQAGETVPATTPELGRSPEPMSAPSPRAAMNTADPAVQDSSEAPAPMAGHDATPARKKWTPKPKPSPGPAELAASPQPQNRVEPQAIPDPSAETTAPAATSETSPAPQRKKWQPRVKE